MGPFAYHINELSCEGVSLRAPADVGESGDFLAKGARFRAPRKAISGPS